MRMKELIEDMGRLEMELHKFETRFGVKSADFYEAMTRGELEEFDALDKYRMEFIEWLALYKTWLSLNDKYRQPTPITNTFLRTSSTTASRRLI